MLNNADTDLKISFAHKKAFNFENISVTEDKST